MTTNAQGVATAPAFTANSTVGSYTVTATATGVATPANFSLTNNGGPPASITATAGTPQSAPISTVFTTPLQATVRDAGGNVVSGASVTFAAPGSGASGSFTGSATVTSNAQGIATAPAFTANATIGAYSVTASVTGVETRANFSLNNLAGAPASVAVTAGTPQSATINTAFATALQAVVKDVNNNVLSGVAVTFAAPGSGASGVFGANSTVFTNELGVATAPAFTANSTAGTYTATASVSGVASPANFSLTNLAGPPASITATAGTPQSAILGTAFATGLQATVKDSGGNLLSGVSVTFAAPGSGASGTFASSATVTTNAQGIATAPALTANATLGAYTVTASVTGVSAPANFALSNVAGPPASITSVAGTPQSATIGAAFAAALQALVKDSGGNVLSGVSVTFTAPASGASGAFGGSATVTTNASGIATAPAFTANSTAGAYTVTASVAGVSAPANFALTNLAGPPASVTAVAGTPQSVIVSTAIATPLQAVVKDAGGNLLSGVSVTFAAPGSGASGVFTGSVTVITNAQGIATAPAFTANATLGAYTVTASVTGVATPANFALTDVPAVPVLTIITGSPQSATNGTPFAAPLQVRVSDTLGHVLSGVTVAFTAPASGATATLSATSAVTNAFGLASVTATANAQSGAYSVTASANGGSAVFGLTNTAPVPLNPTVNPTFLNFQYIVGGDPTAATQTLDVTANVPTTFNITSNASWLVIKSSGVTPASVKVAINPANLTPGLYLNAITVVFSDLTLVTIPVRLTVIGPPNVTATPSTLTFTAAAGSTTAQTQNMTISSAGQPVSVDFSSNVAWLTVTPAAATTPMTAQVTANAAGLAAGSYTGVITATAAGSANGTVTITVTLTVTPTFSIGAVNNAASMTPGAAPNTILSAFGTFPGCSSATAAVDGAPTSVFYSSATQINFLMPASVANEGAAQVTLSCAGASAAAAVPIITVAPGIFTATQNGAGQAAIVNQNGSVNTPAPDGTYIEVFGTGFGLFGAPGPDGLSRLALNVTATVGGLPAQVFYAGEAPGFTPGLQQIDVLVPAGAPHGSVVTLQLTLAGVSTTQSVTLAIQ